MLAVYLQNYIAYLDAGFIGWSPRADVGDDERAAFSNRPKAARIFSVRRVIGLALLQIEPPARKVERDDESCKIRQSQRVGTGRKESHIPMSKWTKCNASDAPRFAAPPRVTAPADWFKALEDPALD